MTIFVLLIMSPLCCLNSPPLTIVFDALLKNPGQEGKNCSWTQEIMDTHFSINPCNVEPITVPELFECQKNMLVYEI